MSRWTQFDDQEIPQTASEACVFLSHARLHLLNRLGGPLYQEHDFIIGAWNAVNDEAMGELVA